MNRIIQSFGIGLILMTFGCAKREQAVSLDFSRVEAEMRQPKAALHDPSQIQVPSTSESKIVVPGVASRELIQDDLMDRGKVASTLLKQSQAQAYKELLKRLRDSYYADIERQEIEDRHSLEHSKKDGYDKAFDQAKVLFDEYASLRGPELIALATIAGFPDPDKQSRRQAPPDEKWLRADLEKAKDLRSKIVSQDAEFQKRVDALIASVQEKGDLALTKLLLEGVRLRTEADKRAEDEAAKQTLVESSRARSELVSDNVIVEGQPNKTVQLPAVSAPNSFVSKLADSQSGVKLDLVEMSKAWAAISGFRIVKGNELGKDKTAEFIQWLKERRDGR